MHLKSVNSLLDKLQPYLSKVQPYLEKAKPYCNKALAYVNYILIGLCVVFVIIFFMSFSDNEETRIATGKRAKINVESAVVTIRQSAQAQIEHPQEEGDSPQIDSHEAQPAVKITSDQGVKVAIIIKSLGLNSAISDSVIAMDSKIALSFSPYSPNIAQLISQARQQNHEILLDIPMETNDYPRDDSGPFTLLTHAGKAKNMYRLKSVLALTDDFVGIVSTVGEKLTRSTQALVPIIDELYKKNIPLIYNENTHNVFVQQEARSIGLPTIKHYHVIDEILTIEEIDKKLDEVHKVMTEDEKSVLIIGRPYPITLNRIRHWLKSNKDRIALSNVADLIIKN